MLAVIFTILKLASISVVSMLAGIPAFPSPQLVDVTFASSPSAVATLLEYVRAQLDLPAHPIKARPSPLDAPTTTVRTLTTLPRQ